MVKRLSILLLLMGCFIKSTMAQDNLVPNAGFENGSPPAEKYNQMNRLSDWKKIDGASADWYGSSYYGYFDKGGDTRGDDGPRRLKPFKGESVLGFGPCEGAQIKLDQSTIIGDLVSVSFYWSPRAVKDTEIEIYLLASKYSSDLGNSCSDHDIDGRMKFVVQVNTEGLNPEHVPGEWYHYQSPLRYVPNESYERKWLLIKGKSQTGVNNDQTFSSWEYIYIDEVKVVSQDACANDCTNKEEMFLDVDEIPTGMVGNTTKSFLFLIYNAMSVDFIAFHRWGGIAYEYHLFDINGLGSNGIDNEYAFIWHGDNLNGNDIPDATLLNYTLDIDNCSSRSLNFVRDITITSIYKPPAFSAPAEIHNYELECCPDNKYFQNETLSGVINSEVNNMIYVGDNVDPSSAQGPVTVLSDAVLNLKAGYGVDIDPNVDIEPGATIDVTIAPCGYQKSLVIGDSKFGDLFDASMIKPKEEKRLISNKESISVYPNPVSETLNIELPSSNCVVELWSVLGKLIDSKINQSLVMKFSMIDLQAGIYIVRVISENEVFEEKVVKR
ncbi:MAG: T9SS type A sorting domain-containing protein [Flavobacteriales bacterium]|nr:T9SS type A sorting domain-containing protein [Flavobacteriales bacterium]